MLETVGSQLQAYVPELLSLPVSLQQVREFDPQLATRPPMFRLSDGTLYYGEIDRTTGMPQGRGIALFKVVSTTPTGGLTHPLLTPSAAAASASVSSMELPWSTKKTLLEAFRVYRSGDRYGGQWARGCFEGEGVLLTASFAYQGGWCEGHMHGRAMIQYDRTYVDCYPNDTDGERGLDTGVSTLLLRGLSYLSPFEDSAQKPKEYIGEMEKFRLRHGYGIMRYYNGDVYEGKWFNNRRHGQGKLLKADGEIHEGMWERDERNGYGTIQYTDGNCFKGMLEHNMRSGEGVMAFTNGDEYYGNFSKNHIEGHGTMRFKNGDVYVGHWKNGVRHGEGKYTLKRKGAIVRGNFTKGLIEGNGTVELPGVSLFVGFFERGERTKGTLFWNSADSSDPVGKSDISPKNEDPALFSPSEGSAGTPSGVSSALVLTSSTTTDAIQKAAPEKKCYQGEWAGEKMQGKGLLWYSNGDFYYGYFNNNKRHGPGNMRYAESGNEFSGNFVQDVRHGFAIEQSSDGIIKAGWWENDEFVEGYHGEWNGVNLHGVGRLKLAVQTFLSQDCRKVYLKRGTCSNRESLPSPSMMMNFFGIFQNGLRNGEGILKLPFLSSRSDATQICAGDERRCDLYGPCNIDEGQYINEMKNDKVKEPSRLADTGLLRQHVIKGHWCDDVLDSEYGVWAFPSGDVYCGPFSKGMRSGPEGRLWLSNGSVYVGGWRENVPCGDGCFYVKSTTNPIYIRLDTSHAHHQLSLSLQKSRNLSPITSAENHNDPNSRVKDIVFSLWNASSYVEPTVEENRKNDVKSIEQPPQRVLVGYRDDYALVGRWNKRVVSMETYKELIVPQLNELASMKRVSPLRDSTMSQVTLRRCDPPGKGKSPTEASQVAPIKTPAAISIGEYEGLSIVLYTSGVWVQSFFIGNYPMLLTPYLPGSAFDCYLQRLSREGHLPKGYQPPSQASSLTASLRAVVEGRTRNSIAEPGAKTRNGNVKENVQSRNLMNFDCCKKTFEMEVNTAAMGINTTSARHPLVRSIGEKGDADLGTTSVTCCTFCKKAYNFFRSPKPCTLCLRSACASCLFPMETTSSRRPDVDALIARSLILQQRVLQYEKKKSINKDSDLETSMELSSQSITSVPACVSCARSVMLGIQSNIMWIPMQIINSVLSPAPMKTSETNKTLHGVAKLKHPKNEETPKFWNTPVEHPIENGSDGATIPSSVIATPAQTTAAALEAPAGIAPLPVHQKAHPRGEEVPRDETPSLRSPTLVEGPPLLSLETPSHTPTLGEPTPGFGPPLSDPKGSEALSSSLIASSQADYIVYAGYTAQCVPHLWGELWWGGRNKGYYHGGFCFGERHGYGVQIMTSGEKYEGGFKHNVWSGRGNYFVDDGSVLQGIFRRGRLHRLCYHGEVDSYRRPHGRGVSYEVNGSIYNGEWHHGERRGTGVLQDLDGRIYSGEFRNGHTNGKGKLIEGGNVYYGDFVASLKHGRGVEFFGLQAMEGQWERGKSNGHCKIWDSTTNELYEATHRDGKEQDDCFLLPVKVEDRLSVECLNCKVSFSLFLRRHHCRLCGGIFCDTCSRLRATLPDHFLKNAKGGVEACRAQLDAQRVCDACFSRLQQRRMVAIKRYSNKAVYAGCWSQGQWVSRGLYCRPDGVFIVMDNHGKPILPGSGTINLKQAGSSNGGDGTNDTCDSKGDSSPHKLAVTCTEAKLQDASPTREELNALTESSPQKELDLFTAWWAKIVEECKLMVPLEVPLIRQNVICPEKLSQADGAESQMDNGSPSDVSRSESRASTSGFPKPPVVPLPKLFVSLLDTYHERKASSRHENPASPQAAEDGGVASRNATLTSHKFYNYEDENVHHALLRAARFAPEVIPCAPPLPQRRRGDGDMPEQTPLDESMAAEAPSDPSALTGSETEDNGGDRAEGKPYAAFLAPPPKLEAYDHSDAAVLQDIVEARQKGWLDSSTDRPMPLIAPSPPPPSYGTNTHIFWEDWATREVPTYKGNAEKDGQPGPSPSEALSYVSCPFWKPKTTDVQGVLVAGKMHRAVEMILEKDAAYPSGERSNATTAPANGAEDPAEALLTDDTFSDISSEGSGVSLDGIPLLEGKNKEAKASRKGCDRRQNLKPPTKASLSNDKEVPSAASSSGWLPAPLTGPFRFNIKTLPVPMSSDGKVRNATRVKVSMTPYGLKDCA